MIGKTSKTHDISLITASSEIQDILGKAPAWFKFEKNNKEAGIGSAHNVFDSVW